jgi:ribosomal protein S27AE
MILETGSEKEVHVRQSELFRLVEEFLNDRRSNQKCDRCGSPMQHLDGQFLLYRTVLKWDMGLPFCPRCDEGIEACFHRINGIAAKAKAADSENTT